MDYRNYETTFRQLMNNGSTTLPANANIDKIGDVYLDAWYDMAVNKNSASGAPPFRSGKALSGYWP